MSSGVVALLAAAGIAAWTYNKLQRRTGYGNTRNAVIGAAVVFALVFIVVFTIAHALLGSSNS